MIPARIPILKLVSRLRFEQVSMQGDSVMSYAILQLKYFVCTIIM